MFTNHVLRQIGHHIVNDFVPVIVHPDRTSGETPGVFLHNPLLQPGAPLAYMALVTGGSRVSPSCM